MHKKSAFTGRSIRGSDVVTSSEDVGVQVRNVHDVGIPRVHILSKNDIENELIVILHSSAVRASFNFLILE